MTGFASAAVVHDNNSDDSSEKLHRFSLHSLIYARWQTKIHKWIYGWNFSQGVYVWSCWKCRKYLSNSRVSRCETVWVCIHLRSYFLVGRMDQVADKITAQSKWKMMSQLHRYIARMHFFLFYSFRPCHTATPSTSVRKSERKS